MKKQIKNSLINMLLNKNVFKRPQILIYVIFFSLFFNSCDKKIADIPDSNIEKGELAVEIFNHSPCLNKIEFLSEAKHPDFLSPEIKSMAQTNTQAMKRMNSNSSEIDTIFSLEEIPIYKEKITSTRRRVSLS